MITTSRAMSQGTSAPTRLENDEAELPLGRRLREIALLFTRLGFTAFGGPAVHTAMMEDEVVRRRRWIDREHFLDLVSTLNFIPGPNSTELAIHLGLIRAGFAGLLVAGSCFILPAVLIILPIAWAYVRFGTLPQWQHFLQGVSAAVVAILAVAAWRFARAAVRDTFTTLLGAGALMAAFLLQRSPRLQPELLILATAAVVGVVWRGRPARVRLPLFSVFFLPFASGSAVRLSEVLRLALFFLKVGATLFGSGYVLVSYLQSGLVDARPAWLTPQQLLDAIAVGQVTPGPLLTTATFIGYVCGERLFGTIAGAVLTALVTTAAIFLPSFVFVALLGPLLPRLRRNRFARGALDGMNAAVVALIVAVTVRLGMVALHDRLGILIAIAALVAVLVWRVNAAWLILIAGAVGWLATIG